MNSRPIVGVSLAHITRVIGPTMRECVGVVWVC